MQAQQGVDVGDTSEQVEDWQGSLSSRRPKTPRCDGGLSPGPSPNARSRKIRKGARDKDEEEGQVLIPYDIHKLQAVLGSPIADLCNLCTCSST